MKKTAMTLCFFLVSILLTSFAWGYELPTAWEIKFNNVEQVFVPSIDWDPAGIPVQIFTVGDGIEDNWGIAQITSIIDREGPSPTVVWSDGDNGEHMTIMFWGLEVYQITAIDMNLDGTPDKFKLRLEAATTTLEGFSVPDLDGDGNPDATMTVWLDNDASGSYTAYDTSSGPGARTSASAYPAITDGIKQGDFIFRPGIVDTDVSALTQVDSDTLTEPFTGDGAGYLDAMPGSGPFADSVNTDGFATAWGARDVFLMFDFRPHPDPGLPDYGWVVNSEDPAIGAKGEVEEPGECRVTAGGNKDGVAGPCVLKSNGMPDTKTCASDIYHTWGGQAGAPPRIDGNWTHHYKKSNKNNFGFHSNELFYIMCSDPGPHCEPAGCYAPSRQIDFAGIGRFTHKKGEYESFPDGDLCFHVHLEDIGEPGRGGKWPSSVAAGLDCEHCPGTPIVNGDPDDLNAQSDCRDCTDYYEIKIYDSAAHDDCGCTGNVLWVNGSPDTVRCGPGDPQLEGFFTRAGNVQMHRDNNGP